MKRHWLIAWTQNAKVEIRPTSAEIRHVASDIATCNLRLTWIDFYPDPSWNKTRPFWNLHSGRNSIRRCKISLDSKFATPPTRRKLTTLRATAWRGKARRGRTGGTPDRKLPKLISKWHGREWWPVTGRIVFLFAGARAAGCNSRAALAFVVVTNASTGRSCSSRTSRLLPYICSEYSSIDVVLFQLATSFCIATSLS